MTDHTPEQLKAAIDDAMTAMRTEQTAFDAARADVIAARERINRIRSEAEKAAADEIAARQDWNVVFRGSDGQLSEDLLQQRRKMMAVSELADDYRRLLNEADSDLQALEVPALECAHRVEGCRSLAASLIAEDEMRKVIAKCAPILARAIAAKKAALPYDTVTANRTTYIEPHDGAFAELKRAVKMLETQEFDLPADIAKRYDIAPLSWADASSPLRIMRRKAALSG